ncbi:HAD family hydrolase [Candidatus Woesearchaeota archaeon]|nr:HAD family hydrolase [Candidatus Woesearchaeota archaeon]
MKTILFDWDGTIAKKEVATKAAMRRGESLGITYGMGELHEKQKTHSHYKDAKKAIKSYVGELDEDIITQLMTNFFQYHYLGVVREAPEEVFYKDILSVLEKLREKYKLVIVSTIRHDIIRPVLKQLNYDLFSEVFANNPELEHSKEELVRQALEKHDATFMVGDREEDIEAGKKHGLKTVLVDWGYAQNLKEAKADYKITKPEELLGIIN